MKGLQSKQVTMYKYIFEKQKLKLLLSNKLKFMSGGPESRPKNAETTSTNPEEILKGVEETEKLFKELATEKTLRLESLIKYFQKLNNSLDNNYPETKKVLEQAIKNSNEKTIINSFSSEKYIYVNGRFNEITIALNNDINSLKQKKDRETALKNAIKDPNEVLKDIQKTENILRVKPEGLKLETLVNSLDSINNSLAPVYIKTKTLLEKTKDEFKKPNEIDKYRTTSGIIKLFDNIKNTLKEELSQGLPQLKEAAKEAVKNETIARTQEFNKDVISIITIEKKDIKFSSKADTLNEEERKQFMNGTVVKVNRKTENLRDPDNPGKVLHRLPQGTELTVTNKKYLVKNGKQERLYIDVQTSDGKKGMIIAKSTDIVRQTPPVETTPETAKTTETKTNTPQSPETKSGISTAESLIKTAKEQSEKLDKKQDLQRLGNRIKQISKQKVDSKYLSDPKELKKIIDQDQIPYADRNIILDTMQRFNFTTEHIADFAKDNYITMNELIVKTPDERENEFKRAKEELKKDYLKSDGKETQQKIENLESKLNDKKLKKEDKEKLTTELNELKSKQENDLNQYTRLQYENWMKKEKSRYENTTDKYLVTTAATLDAGNEEEFRVRYEKLQRLAEFAETLSKLSVSPPKLENLSPDEIRKVEIDDKAKESIINYAKKNAKDLNISKEQLSEIEDIVDDEPLQLLATLLYSEGNYKYLVNKEILIKRNDKIKLNTEKFTSSLQMINMKSLVKALSYQKELGFPDNLTECLLSIQKSPNYEKIRQAVYDQGVDSAILDDSPTNNYIYYAHLRRIFDTNYTGKFMENESWFGDDYITSSQADFASGRNVGAMTEKFDRDYTSDLSLYSNFVSEIEENGIISNEKFVNKINYLIEKGKLAISFDERLTSKQRENLINKSKEFTLSKNNKNELYQNFPPEIIKLIKYGSVYEQLKDNFIQNSPNSPAKKFEEAGLISSKAEFGGTMDAIASTVEMLSPGKFDAAIGTGAEKTFSSNGWNIKFAGSTAVMYKDPSLGSSAVISISPDGNNYRLSAFANAKISPQSSLKDILTSVGVGGRAEYNIDLGKYDKITATLGGGYMLGGIALDARVGYSRNSILKSQDENFQKGVENISGNKKLTEQEIAIIKNIDINKAKPEELAQTIQILNLGKAFDNSNPDMVNLSSEQRVQYMKGFLKVVQDRINNMSIEDAKGVNWGISIGVAYVNGLVVPVLLLSFEFQGKTTLVQCVNNEQFQFKQEELRKILKEQIKNNPNQQEFTIETQSGHLTIDTNGNQKFTEFTEKNINSLNYKTPQEKLNSLRGTTGLEFKKSTKENIYIVNLDQYKNADLNESAVETEIYIDPVLSKYIAVKTLPVPNHKKLAIAFKDGKIPDNLVILKETFTNPTTAGRATTRTQLSFTTRENSLTGSELKDHPEVSRRIHVNTNGETFNISLDNNHYKREAQRLNTNVSFESKELTSDQIKQLSKSSEKIKQLSTSVSEKNKYQPSEQIKEILNKLSTDQTLQKEIAKLTTITATNKKVNYEEIFNILTKSANIKLTPEDKLYILGNLMPGTFRSIDQIKPEKREETINKIIDQYIEENVKLLTDHYKKSNGQEFSEQEKATIVKTLQTNSRVTAAIKKSIDSATVAKEKLTAQNTLGSLVYTTAHRGDLRGLREILNSEENPIEIVKDSFKQINGNDAKLVSEFLKSISDPLTEISNKPTSSITTKEIQDIANSKTSLMLLSTTTNIEIPNNEGKKDIHEISLASLIFGPKQTELISKIFDNNFSYEKLTPEEKETLKNFAKIVEDLHTKNDIKIKTYNDAEITLKTKELSAVVLMGHCANPTMLYNRSLSAKYSINTPNLAAAKGQASGTYKLGKAQRTTYSTPGIGISLRGKQEKSEPRKPNTPPGGGGGETPRKANSEAPTQATTQPNSTPSTTPPASSSQGRTARASRRRT